MPREPLPEQAIYRGLVLTDVHLIRLVITCGLVALILIGSILAWFLSLPDIRSVDDYRPLVATLVLDRFSRPIDAVAREFRIVMPLEAMPQLLPKAFVAAEDSRFFAHEGLDFWSITRAAVNNLRSGRRSQGGSTITQQVTRALLLSREKSFLRKLAEAVLSFRLERMLSKEDILTIYLNEIYLGEGAYGVEAAARTYFGKSVGSLSLGEIALLAGLPQSPSNYSPLKQPQAARDRQRYVLNRMAEDGIITAGEARAAFEQDLQLAGGWRRNENGYFSLYVRSHLLTRHSETELFEQGLRVATTVDARLQEAAARAVADGVARVAARHPDSPPPQAALVALDTASGRIRAMIGGTDFSQSQFNRAVQAVRQPGSAFKPLLFAAALARGITPDRVVDDTPLAVSSGGGRLWQPHNFNNEYRGRIPLGEALVYSSNVVAVRLLQDIGAESLITLAREMGITSPMEADLSLALGAAPVSMLELTAAYTAFANQGMYHSAVGITRVRDRQGRVRPWPQAEGRQVLSSQNAAWLHSVLTQAVVRGTGKAAAAVTGASGKTGTTDSNVDAWFIGSAGDLTCGVWLGHDRSASLGAGETGGLAAAPVWKAFMLEALREEQNDDH